MIEPVTATFRVSNVDLGAIGRPYLVHGKAAYLSSFQDAGYNSSTFTSREH